MKPVLLKRNSNFLIGFSFILGIFSTLLVTLPLMRLVRPLGVLDELNSKKVHEQVSPRVGGIGVALGVLPPTLLWRA